MPLRALLSPRTGGGVQVVRGWVLKILESNFRKIVYLQKYLGKLFSRWSYFHERQALILLIANPPLELNLSITPKPMTIRRL